MVMGSGLLALAMVAADGPSCPPVETATYQVRILTLDGLDWRTSSYPRLQRVAYQGTSTIWTSDRALAASLADRAKGDSPCHTIMAVGEASMMKADAVNYIAAMDRVADGPMNQSSAIAFMPRPEKLEERFFIRVAGRKLDQGVLTKIEIEETHVDIIHDVPQSETLVPPASKSAKNVTELGRDVLNVILSATSDVPQATAITSSVQIPEISQASVSGEWLIPNDGVLLVSLGVKTAADDKGKAVVRERIAVIEACAGAVCPGVRATPVTPAVDATAFEHVKLGHPVVPGRSLPEAVDPNGNVLDLPPLPEAVASADLDRFKPEPYQPSPQNPLRSAPSPSADPALARTNFDSAPPAPKAPMEFEEVVGEDFNVDLSILLKALAKSGVKVPDEPKFAVNLLKAMADAAQCDADAQAKDSPKAKAVCPRCDGDTTFCPATARDFKVGIVAGGIKMVSEEAKPQVGVTIKDANGVQVYDAVANLEDVLKMPGKTGTTVFPLGDNVSLEIKATVVAAPAEKAQAAAKKDETPSTKR
jgi:hypothetical protein